MVSYFGLANISSTSQILAMCHSYSVALHDKTGVFHFFYFQVGSTLPDTLFRKSGLVNGLSIQVLKKMGLVTGLDSGFLKILIIDMFFSKNNYMKDFLIIIWDLIFQKTSSRP